MRKGFAQIIVPVLAVVILITIIVMHSIFKHQTFSSVPVAKQGSQLTTDTSQSARIVVVFPGQTDISLADTLVLINECKVISIVDETGCGQYGAKVQLKGKQQLSINDLSSSNYSLLYSAVALASSTCDSIPIQRVLYECAPGR